MPLRWTGYGREGRVSDNYGYDPRETDFDPTVNYYPPPPQYAPPAAPLPPDPMATQPTSQAASAAQPIYVPYPVVVSDDGDSMALSSLIFGIISAAVGWIPVCGLVALLPAILGIVFGGLGLKSERRRGMAVAGMLLSIVGIVLAFIIFV
jgi:hypothetical protein